MLSGISLGGANPIEPFAGVGFALNPVATFTGTINGQVDNTPGDYHVQVNWGDGGGYSSKGVQLVAVGYSILVKSSHVYTSTNTYNVSVEVTGPGGTSAQGQTTQALVSQLPDPASRPPTIPANDSGAQPLGTVSLSLGGANPIEAFAGVGFALNPVAQVTGSYNGFIDNTPGDYHAQVNWGDSPNWDSKTGLVAVGNSILIKGSHNYQQQGTFDVSVYLTGPDGQTVSTSTIQVLVSQLPDPASRPPDVPERESGAQPLGQITLSVGGANPIEAQTGVGIAGALVGAVYGTYNGQSDNSVGDYHAQINWGDSPAWVGGTLLAQKGGGNSLSIYGSHTYNQTGTYDVTLYVTGPDGQTDSVTTDQVIVSQAPGTPPGTTQPTSPNPTPTTPSPTPASPDPTSTNPNPTPGQPTPTPPFVFPQIPLPFPSVPPATSAIGPKSNRSIDKEFMRLLNGMVEQTNAIVQALEGIANFAALPQAQKQQLVTSAFQNAGGALGKLANAAQKDPTGTTGKILSGLVQQVIQAGSDNNAAGTGGKLIVSELAAAAAASTAKKLTGAVAKRLFNEAGVEEPPQLQQPSNSQPTKKGGTAALEGGLESATVKKLISDGEQVLSAKVGKTDKGFDVASWIQTAKGPQLIITEVKNFKGNVPGSKFTAIGFGKQGADLVNLKRLQSNIAVVADSIRNDVSDPAIQQELLSQLSGTSATQPVLRLVGSQAKGTVFNQSLMDSILQDISPVLKLQLEWPPTLI